MCLSFFFYLLFLFYFIFSPFYAFSVAGPRSASVGHLTRKSEVLGSIPTYCCFSTSADSRGVVVSYWRNYVHEVLVNRLGGLSLPRKGEVRLTDRPDMALHVYRGGKTRVQQQQSFQCYQGNYNSGPK